MLKKILISLMSLIISITPIMAITNTASAASTNLFSNPSVELNSNNLPTDWSTAKTGTNTTAFNYLNTGHTGSHSLQVKMTRRTSGQAEWVGTPITVASNTNYTYTDWYISNVSTTLSVNVKTNNGATSTLVTKNVTASSAWKQSSVSFKTPSNAVSVSIYHYLNKVGQLTLDDFSLQEPVPTVAISSPINNSSVSGNSTIAASATNTIGVQFKVDNLDLGTEDTLAPYSLNWDTTTVANGSHTITAVARNASGVTATNSISVNVQNIITPPVTTDNLITNPSAETANGSSPASWSYGSWGTNSPTYTYENNGHTGSRSVKTQITSFSNGDAKWYFNPVTVEAGKTYSYSHFYKTNATTDVVVQFTDTAGNNSYMWLNTLAASSSWQQYNSNFTVPTGIVKVTVLQVLYSIGWVQIDDVLLTQNEPATQEIITNSSFELSSGTSPTSWLNNSWGTNTASFEYMNEGHTGSHSAKVTVSNYTDGDAKWYFNPITNLQRGGQYNFSTWYKTNSIPHAVAMFIKDDGTEQYLSMPNPQPNGTTVWQYYSGGFQVPTNVKAVSVFFLMQDNGWLQIDDQTITPYQPTGFNRPLISITFDDGPIENVTSALPLLNSYSFKTTNCFISSTIENDPSQAQSNVMAFFNSGHEICSHTVSHPFLSQLSGQNLDYELLHSKQYLESITGQPVVDFVSPYGDYNASVITAIKQYYQSHRTVNTGFNSRDSFNEYELKVQNILNTTTASQVREWITQAQTDNTWLILVYHRIASDAGDYDTLPSVFSQQLQEIQNSGIVVKTVKDALAEVKSQL